MPRSKNMYNKMGKVSPGKKKPYRRTVVAAAAKPVKVTTRKNKVSGMSSKMPARLSSRIKRTARRMNSLRNRTKK